MPHVGLEMPRHSSAPWDDSANIGVEIESCVFVAVGRHRFGLTVKHTSPLLRHRYQFLYNSTRSTLNVAPIVKDNNALSSRFDWQWGMPSLSSYTAFESLFFFQYLSTFESRPSNLTPISELLTNNSFVRQDATFDKARLTPQALEVLYADLVKEELQNREGTPSGHGPTGYCSESENSNPKKRKIQDRSSKQMLDGASYSTVIPALVARLYARYKEMVTREIEEEERKYSEIKDEIQRLEIGEVSQQTLSVVDGPSVTPQASEQVAQRKPTPVQDSVASNSKVQEKRSVTETPQAPRSSDQLHHAQTQQHAQSGLAQGQKAIQQALQMEGKSVNVAVPTSACLSSQFPRTQQIQQSGQQSTLQNISARSLAPSSANRSAPFPTNEQVPARSSQYGTLTPSQPAEGSTVSQVDPGAVQSQALPPIAAASTLPAMPSLHATPTPTGVQQPQPLQPTTATFQPVQYIPLQTKTSQTTPAQNTQQPLSQPQSPLNPNPYAHVSPYASAPYSTSQLTGKTPLPFGQAIPHAQPDVNKALQSPCGSPREASRPLGVGLLPQQLQSDTRSRTSSQESCPNTPLGNAGSIRLDSGTPSFSALLSRRPPRPSVDTSGVLTPWKKPSPIAISKSPGSPLRPKPEDVSPISERVPSPTFEIESPSSISKSHLPYQGADVDFDTGPAGNTRRRKTTPAFSSKAADNLVSSPLRITRNRNRAQSNEFRDDESITDSGSVTQRKIKHEMPSTPSGISDDTEMEQRSSSRLRAPKQAQVDESLSKRTSKRKRGQSEASGFEDANQPPNRQENQYVQCTRNFPRTCAPIMNYVASHKYASIFAKPLTERDVPGYKNLIYRSQDIKSIKSAVYQGSKAVTAATVALNTPSGDNIESPGPSIGTSTKTNGLLLKRTAELIPPKGIVNSAQLEMELVRMFANAVMFNPTSDRAFGPSFPMQSDSVSREGTQDSSDFEEGGIINDTLEMYDDVEKAVSRWRAAERAVDDMGGKSMLSLRRGSASDINMDSADEVK
ncbi:hypothetical protein PABG_05234 [Paracoccidioides brasiliensis Pb03]|nr:hypothetical protein PABG_05234 [Paracoccidioides brasiliensis Pb03]